MHETQRLPIVSARRELTSGGYGENTAPAAPMTAVVIIHDMSSEARSLRGMIRAINISPIGWEP